MLLEENKTLRLRAGIDMTKEAILTTVQEIVQQKSAIASMGSGIGAASTWYIDGISPHIPILSFIAMLVFGFINVWINWKKLKAVKAGASNGNK